MREDKFKKPFKTNDTTLISSLNILQNDIFTFHKDGQEINSVS